MFWRHAQVQKSAEHYTEAAQDEIDLLAAIAGHAHRSAEGAAACVRMLDNFEHRGPHGRHVCMVFEVRRGWSGCRCPLAASLGNNLQTRWPHEPSTTVADIS